MSSIANDEFIVKVGPRGETATPSSLDSVGWDESGYGSVRHIFITHGAAINSMQVFHELNGTRALADRHGGVGNNFDSVVLEPREYLTVVSGRYGSIVIRGATIIRSLTFVTNLTSYGPFGREEGQEFCFNLNPKLEFWGFYGRSNCSFLCAIGLYVKCISSSQDRVEPPRSKPSTLLNC